MAIAARKFSIIFLLLLRSVPHNSTTMKIPWQSLSEAALAGLIQEFVTREGTEYGAVAFNLEEKTHQVRLQIQAGEAEIEFDLETQTTTVTMVDTAIPPNP